FKDWVLYLIDDGSTDKSLKIAQKFVNSDKRIILINDGTNKGLVYRLNQVIDRADTDYIARMDADDVMLPERLERQLEIFENNKNVDIVATAAYTIDMNNNPVGIRDTEKFELRSYKDILKKSVLIHPSILVKTKWYKLNMYDKDYFRAEDFELWCRTFKNTVFFKIPEPLMLYREGNVSIKNYTASMKTLRKIIKKYSKGVLSNFEIKVEILKTHLKSLIYISFGFFNLQYLLTKKRNNDLSEDQKEFIINLIINLKE
ncbi:glycosyltransferase family 2 protein, partial [Flavobacterium sp. HMWF030]